MKRFLALAIAVIMILSFAACASDKSGSDGSDTTSASDIKTDATTAPAAEDTTAEPETTEPATSGTDAVSAAPSVRRDPTKTTTPAADTTKPASGGSSGSTTVPSKPDDSKPAAVETNPKKIIVSAEKEWIFTEKPTDSCHASTVLPLDNGTVVAAWFAGSSESDDDVKILTSVRGTDGKWGEPIRVSADPNVAHWNPVLFQNDDGTITLYFKVGKDTEYWKTYYSVSTDGKNWAAPRELVPGDNSGGRGPVKNKPIRLKNGTILAPASTEIDGKWRAFVDISTDNGKTWNRTPEINSSFLGFFKVPMIQPTLWESKDGSVHMLTRTKVGRIYRSDSYDGGKTWCTAYPTNLPNNNSGIDLDTDDSGRIFLVYNPVGIPDIRTPLTLAVSFDDGKTFTKIKTFETGLAEYSYPAVVVKGDTIHITYTYERNYIAYWQIKIK